jgi:hypothetical protein
MKPESRPHLPATPPAVRQVDRPWGAFRQYAHNEPVTVSLMTVEPGQRLSAQSHANRAELWIVHGLAFVRLGRTLIEQRQHLRELLGSPDEEGPTTAAPSSQRRTQRRSAVGCSDAQWLAAEDASRVGRAT